MRSIQKIKEGLLLSLPSLIALFVLTSFVRTFDYAKNLVFVAVLLLVFFATIFSLFKKGSLDFFRERLKSPAAKGVAIFVWVIFLATLFSPQRLNSIFGSSERGMGLMTWITLGLYFWSLLLFVSKKAFHRGFEFLIWTGTLIAVYAILQHFGFDPVFGGFNSDYLEGRVFSTLGNPDFLAQFLAPLICFALYKGITRRKTFYVIPVGIMLWALLYTESRASFLALALVCGICLWKQLKRKKLFALLAATAVIMVFLLSQTGLPLFDRLSPTAVNLRSLESRFQIWKVSAQMIAEHPFLGVGPDNYGIYFPQYMSSEIYTLEDDLNIQADRSHNEFLDIGTIGGIPLMVLYLAFWGWIFYLTFSKKEKNLEPYCLALLVLFFQNQLTFSQLTHTVLFFFLLAALLSERVSEQTMEWRPTPLFRWVGTPLLFVFAVFLTKEMFVDRYFAEAWYSYALSTDDTEQGLQNAITFDPTNLGFRYDLIMWFPQETLAQLPAIRKIEGESIEVLGWEASILSTENPQAAYVIFEKAIALNPNYYHTHRAYADALYRQGEFERAAVEYEAALANAPDFWTWCSTLSDHSDYEQKKFRIFYKNVPDFNNTLQHLYESYSAGAKKENLGESLKCLGVLLDSNPIQPTL